MSFFHSFTYSPESAPPSGITCPHIPGHLLAPANFLGCPRLLFHCPPGLRLRAGGRMGNPNVWPRLKWGHAGPRPPGRPGRGPTPAGRRPPLPCPSPLPPAHSALVAGLTSGSSRPGTVGRPMSGQLWPLTPPSGLRQWRRRRRSPGCAGPAGPERSPGPWAGELRWRPG